MMENIPGKKLSSVSSYDMLGSFVVVPIGTLIYGWMITLLVPSVWRMGRPEVASTIPA